MKIRLTGKKEVYNFCEPYIIAELASNHNGDMGLAKEMITRAHEAGADCVKFQSWTKDTIFSKIVYEENRFLNDDYRDRADYTLEKIVEEYAVGERDLVMMKEYTESIGIDFASTPFSKREVDFLVAELGASFIKVASMDLNNYSFLKYIASKGLPVVLSTGMGSLYDIEKAISTIENAGNKSVVILHCVSLYPPDDTCVNLNNIDTLATNFPYPVGFSDHTTGISIALSSVAKGACIIEKHFTLDKTMPGWDHKVSADFEELKAIVIESKRINKALGSKRILVCESEEMIQAFRRSIVAARDIKKGEVFTEAMLDFKRPAKGIDPGGIKYVLGKQAKRDITYDEIIDLSDF